MAYELRDFSDIAPATTVNGDITNVSTSIVVASGTGYPSGGASGDFMIQIESEIIRCSSRSTNTLTVSGGVAGRGQNGTTAVAHVTGTTVNHVHTATNDSKEANRAVAKTIGVITTSQDILVCDAANSFTRLGIGANGTILQALAGAVAWGALGANTVGASQITDGSVGSAELAAGAVIAGKIAAGGVSASNQFAAGVVDATALATSAVTSAKILDGTITGTDIANTTIVNANIVDGTITNAKLATPGGSSGGGLGSITSTGSTQSGINAITDITGMSVAVTVPASAVVMIIGHLPATNVGAAGNPSLLIREGATQLQRSYTSVGNSGDFCWLTAIYVGSPTTGAHTYKLSATTSAGTLSTNNSSTQPASLVVLQIV